MIRRLLASPLLHFFCAGGLVFALYAALNPAPPALDGIALGQDEAAELAARFADSWNRPPDAAELEALMRDWAEEEVLVREALALGLDRGDTMVRARLRQKMLFLIEAPAAAMVPGEDALRAWYAANAARYERPAQVSFAQVLLPAGAAPEETEELRRALENGADPARLGRRTLLPPVIEAMPAPTVERVFGAGFAPAVEALPLAEWSGPVPSGYGQHLVRLGARRDAALPPFETVRDQVLADWRAEEARSLRKARIDALLAAAAPQLPSAAEVLGQ
ncbi:peptidyl-prolyl cis-trans isomerase [Poseidonocella sp. HB161398]|uniref:peptidylprolyl isomerase n=1 Tax=Poseidonocella sp. HB161398 TaxID=2320855 RepID=UPI001108AAC4|nr:peptidylprolyl isomerase [Poseidonocella sp. HB161398]